MNTAKLLKEAGSGCCLILPLLGGAAVAKPLVSADLPDGFDPLAFDSSPHPSTSTEDPSSLISVEAALASEDSIGNRWALETKVLGLQQDSESLVLSLEGRNQLAIPSIATEWTADADESEVSRQSHLASNATSKPIAAQAVERSDSSTFGALLVELRTEADVAGNFTLVKGAENGRQAIAFEQWLIPFDDVINALGFSAAVDTDGQIVLRSAEIVTRIQLESLPQDPELGTMWSVADIAEHLGAVAEFDPGQYAIRFNQDTLSRDRSIQLAQSTSASDDLTYSALSAAYLATPSVDAPDTDTPDTDALDTPNAALPKDLLKEPLEETVAIDSHHLSTKQATGSDLGVLLVGLAIDEITTVEATLVKGRENGAGAVALSQWMIPFDDAMVALGADVTVEDDGLWTVRAPGLATSIDPQTLLLDPEIGQAISIETIEDQLGVAAEFDRSQYAIKFSPLLFESASSSWFGKWNRGIRSNQPVVVSDLPTVSPAPFTLSAASQSTRASSSGDRLLNEPVGQLSAVGSAFGGSWYARIGQPVLSDYRSWQLKELQYLRQGDREDYVLGSQPTFWQARNSNQDYWGATTLQRWGFEAPQSRSTAGFSPRTRLQSSQVGRTVSGEAAPGTFVRLTQGLNGLVVDETIVNSSGLYQFENVLANNQLGSQDSDSGYLIQLYANGQLNSQPEIRSAAFTTLPGQLPKGASALIASAGMGYRNESDRMMGSFNTFRGGVAYRYGLSEALTLGAGLVQDGSAQVITEGFYLPENIPLQAAFSALVEVETGETKIDANVRYQPAKNFSLNFKSDRFSQRLKADWNLSPNFSLTASGNTRENTLALEANASYETRQWRGRAMASIDTNQNLRWRIGATRGPLSFSHQGSEVSTFSAATYDLPSKSRSAQGLGHQIALGYQTFNALANASTQTQDIFTEAAFTTRAKSSSLATAEWRYRSPQMADGRSRWDFSVGYGVSDRQSGPIASVTAGLSAGIDFQMRYQGVSIFDEEESLQISLVSRLNTQNGLSWGHRRQDELRTQGGITLRPFFDNNNNGVQDADEPLYLDNPELLFALNHKILDRYQKTSPADSLTIPLSPDTYRIDIDPAGLPIDKTTADTAYAVDVVSGQYTTVAVPLVTTYAVSGVVLNEMGLAVPDALVEVVSVSGHQQQSVTNGAGVYYLERLKPETYELSVNGVLLEDSSIVLEGDDETFLEKEIHLL